MKRASVRLRLTFWYSTAFCAGIAAFGAASWYALDEVLLENRERALEERLAALAEFIEQEALGDDRAAIREEAREYATGMQPGHSLRVRTDRGDLLFERPGEPEADLLVRRADVVIRGNSLELELGAPLDDVQRTLAALRRVMLGLFPVAIALAGLGGWVLARRALAPVDQMTNEARAISAGDLSARLSVPATGDEIQRLAEAWNEVLSRIESSVRGIVRFTADAAHELRTPVTVIRAAAELSLQRDRPVESYRHTLRLVRDETVGMTELLDRLLLLARGDARQWTFKFDAVRTGDAAEAALAAAGPLAERKGVCLRYSEPPESSLVWADADAVRRMILILLDNAIKFTDSGGRVELQIHATPSECSIEVEDGGCGIPASELPRIFERFYRADQARTPGGGAGLGLPIARLIAEAHSGRIDVVSKVGTGTLARIRLPSLAAQAELPSRTLRA